MGTAGHWVLGNFELGALLDKRDSPLGGLTAVMLLMAPFSQ